MSGRRVAIFTRRFWPLCGEAECAIADLAIGLRGAGTPATVVTAQWRKDWPERFVYETLPVVRLPRPSGRWWGDWGYARRLSQWLRKVRDHFDVVIVDRPGHDADAIVNAARNEKISTVVLARRDCTARLPTANAIVIDDESTRDLLASSGLPIERIHTIAPGVPIPIAATGNDRRHARRAVAKACDDPASSLLAPLAVAMSPLDSGSELEMLITAWALVVRRRPDARLWLFGEGSRRAALFDHIERLKLRERVLMPGVMENIDELLIAADLFVAPTARDHAPYFLLSAMAAGKAVVASDTPAHRRLLTSNQHGLLFETDDADNAAAAIERLLGQPILACALGTAARRRAIEQFSMDERVAKFADLFERLIEARDRM